MWDFLRTLWVFFSELTYLDVFKPPCAASVLRIVEGLHTVLLPFHGSHLQSLKGLKNYMQSFNSKEYECSPSTLSRIALEGLKDCICSPSKG